MGTPLMRLRPAPRHVRDYEAHDVIVGIVNSAGNLFRLLRTITNERPSPISGTIRNKICVSRWQRRYTWKITRPSRTLLLRLFRRTGAECWPSVWGDLCPFTKELKLLGGFWHGKTHSPHRLKAVSHLNRCVGCARFRPSSRYWFRWRVSMLNWSRQPRFQSDKCTNFLDPGADRY